MVAIFIPIFQGEGTGIGSWKDLRGWLVDQPAQRQLRHVGNITIAKVTAQREHGGQPMSAFGGKADMPFCTAFVR